MKIKEKKKKTKCHRVDCSNDELVERTMESVLSSYFPDECRALLVADEFHMLKEDQKAYFMRWVSSRLNWLKVFIRADGSNGIYLFLVIIFPSNFVHFVIRLRRQVVGAVEAEYEYNNHVDSR